MFCFQIFSVFPGRTNFGIHSTSTNTILIQYLIFASLGILVLAFQLFFFIFIKVHCLCVEHWRALMHFLLNQFWKRLIAINKIGRYRGVYSDQNVVKFYSFRWPVFKIPSIMYITFARSTSSWTFIDFRCMWYNWIYIQKWMFLTSYKKTET